jgi:hypothetical protein
MSHSYLIYATSLEQNLFAFTDKHKIFGFPTINIRLTVLSNDKGGGVWVVSIDRPLILFISADIFKIN